MIYIAVDKFGFMNDASVFQTKKMAAVICITPIIFVFFFQIVDFTAFNSILYRTVEKTETRPLWIVERCLYIFLAQMTFLISNYVQLLLTCVVILLCISWFFFLKFSTINLPILDIIYRALVWQIFIF